MAIYVQADRDGLPYHVNAYAALKGFQQMGFETRIFVEARELDGVALDNLVVGGVGRIKEFLEKRGILLADVDYPESLRKHFGRKIWRSTSREFLSGEKRYPVFVKPRVSKQFDGFVCRKESDVLGRLSPLDDIPLYCSEVIDIAAEWRCFVRYGEILDIRKYAGSLGVIYDLAAVRKMVEDYAEAPAAYGLDIALTKEGETVAVEVNDGYSLAAYGLDPLLYARLLSARWAQLTGRRDECDFQGQAIRRPTV